MNQRFDSYVTGNTTYVLAAAIQKEEANEMIHEIKIVPLRPNNLFNGALVQQPIAAENK